MVLSHLSERSQATSPNAWNRDRKNLLAMFNWLGKIHDVKNNPVARIDRLPEERRPEYLPPGKDIDKVIMAAKGQDRIMLQCYYYTFARRSELFEWKWEDVNFEKEWYRLWIRKRANSDRQADYFPMPKGSELYKALWWQWNNRDKNSPYVFTNPETGSRFTFRRRFLPGLCKIAGVKPFGYKAFRKYGPSVLNDQHKVSMKKLQRLLRHQSQKTTEIYLNATDEDLAAAVKFLEKGDTKGTRKKAKKETGT